SIAVTDGAGNSTSGTGDTSAKDTTADGAPVATVTFDDVDGFVSGAEQGAASYTVAGVDADASATVTFSDGTPAHDIVVPVAADGSFTVDLSGLDDGPITASIA